MSLKTDLLENKKIEEQEKEKFFQFLTSTYSSAIIKHISDTEFKINIECTITDLFNIQEKYPHFTFNYAYSHLIVNYHQKENSEHKQTTTKRSIFSKQNQFRFFVLLYSLCMFYIILTYKTNIERICKKLTFLISLNIEMLQ